MKEMRPLRKNIAAIIDEIPRGKGASAAKGKDEIGRQQLIAKTLMEMGYDHKIIVPTHASEYPDQHPGPKEITFRPEPKDKWILKDLARRAYVTYHRTKMK